MPKIIPLGNRILCKRRKVGETVGKAKLIIAPQETSERDTDLADIVYVPNLSFADKSLLDSADLIIETLTDKAKQGDSDALNSLLSFNYYLKIKALKVGDTVLISKYVGTTFYDNRGSGELTLVLADDIIGMVIND